MNLEAAPEGESAREAPGRCAITSARYRALRTHGCSAGAYPALLAARRFGAELGHDVFEPMMEHGELGPFPGRTLLAPLDGELVASGRRTEVMRFPLA